MRKLSLFALGLAAIFSILTWWEAISLLEKNDFSPDEMFSARLIIQGKNNPYLIPENSLLAQDYLSPGGSRGKMAGFLEVPSVLASMGETHPPLHYSLLYWWYELWGVSEISGRVLSLFFSLGFALLMTWYGWKHYKTEGALVAIVLCSTSYHVLEYSFNARMHALSLLLFATLIVSWDFLKDNKSNRIALLTFSLSLGLISIQSFVFYLPLALIFLITLYEEHRDPLQLAKTWLLPLMIAGSYWALYGWEQIANLNAGDFTGAESRFGPLISMFYGETSLLRFMPFFSTTRLWSMPIQILLVAAVVLLPLVLKIRYRLWIIFVVAPYLGDVLLLSHTTQWAHGRAINYLLPFLIVLILGLIMKGYTPLRNGLLCALAITNLSYARPMIHEFHHFNQGSFRELDQKVAEHGSSARLFLTSEYPDVAAKVAYYFFSSNPTMSFMRSLYWDEVVEELFPVITDQSYIILVFIESKIAALTLLQLEELESTLDKANYELIDAGEINTYWGEFDCHRWRIYRLKQ
jgi:uncharacterized membrane protein